MRAECEQPRIAMCLCLLPAEEILQIDGSCKPKHMRAAESGMQKVLHIDAMAALRGGVRACSLAT